MNPAPLLLAALLSAGTAGGTEAPAAPTTLSPGSPVEGELPARGSHALTVPLEAGRAYAIDVAQLQTYLDVTWAVGGEERRTNDRTGRSGREEVFWVAADTGTGTLTIRNLASRPGRYRVAITRSEPATDADRERHRAEQDASSRDLALRRAAADRFGALGLEHRRIRVLDRLAYRGVATGALEPAGAAGEQCVVLARAAALEEELSSCLCALARVLQQKGDLDRASALYAEAIELRERRGDPAQLAAALSDAAEIPVIRGDYETAEAMRRRALALGRESGDEASEIIVLLTLGALVAYRGDMEGAVAAFEEGAIAARRIGHQQAEATARVNASVAYGNLGDIERSLARGREGAQLAEAAGLKPLVAMARLTLGGEHDDAGDLAAAERELAAGVAIGRETQDPEVIANGSALLGWVLAQRGDHARAEEQLALALAAAREAGFRVHEATAQMYLGRSRLLAGRPDDAEAPLAQARATFEAVGRPDDLGQTLVAQARLALARGDLTAAEERASAAIRQFDSVRAQAALADQRARYAAFRRQAYDVAVAIQLERETREPRQGHRASAFALTERARARSLQEELAARRAPDPAVPEALATRHRRALDRIGHLQRKLVEGHTSAQPDATALTGLERELADAVAEEEAARRGIRRLTPGRSLDGEPPTAAEVAEHLAPDEALLAYHVGSETSWLFAVTREGLEVARLPGARALRAQTDELRGLLAQPRTVGVARYAAAAADAYRTLVAPALAGRPGIRRLVVVPDGPLWEIPFEALLTEPAPAARFAALPYVLRRFTVSYRPSALGVAPSEGAPAGPARLVAFADPRSASDGVRTSDAMAGVERAVFREGMRWSLDPLPCAAREARDAAGLFGASEARVHAGSGALESRVKSDPEVAGARYLLFSTHALVSDTMPSQSALVLALDGDGAEDGLLQAHEIERLRLTADLVVLSACETALGQNVRGEGLLGLARAFFHAGARRLVASQWRVADCSTARLVTGFFRRLQGPARSAPDSAVPDYADALRQAKLRLLEQPAYAHPYYWAPFVLVG